MNKVQLKILEHDPLSFENALQGAEKLAETFIDPEGTWVISQSLADDIVFEKFTGKMPANSLHSIAGRIFSAKGEVRWLREGARCRMWTLNEGDGKEYYRRREQRYYLWGMRTKDGTFSENRMDRVFEYPLAKDPGVTKDDRAYILVVEYLAAAPSSWPDNVDELERLLNQPEIVAHRYLSVGCGTGSVEVVK